MTRRARWTEAEAWQWLARARGVPQRREILVRRMSYFIGVLLLRGDISLITAYQMDRRLWAHVPRRQTQTATMVALTCE